jgi:hypothetical protein
MKINSNITFGNPWRTVLAVFLLLAVPVAGFTQETTAGIRGKVFDEYGNAIAGATVVIEDMRTGAQRSLTSNESGTFFAAKLAVGGPYKVTVAGTKSVMVDSLSLGDNYNLVINMQSAATIEEIVVIGQTAQIADVAAGPAATFSAYDMEASVAFNRDIKEVYSLDPRLNLDMDGFEMNCGGQHPRFNSVTLDGVSQNDRFGLNSNGYSTATGQPFPFNGIEQVAVEMAPFDVTYSGFSACNINAVSKGGSNEWEFGFLYEYHSDDFRGDKIGGVGTFTSLPFEETTIGFSAGGPIIKDKLFFFATYEESEFPRFLAQGYDGSGNGVERPWLSEADYQRIVDISNNTYQYDPGGLPGDGTQTNESYMVRIDWNVSDKHDVSLIHNFFDGPQLRSSDSDPNEFEFPNHYYVKGAEMETTTVKMNSQWTDAFSTEIYYNNAKMTDSQVTVGPKDFADMQISVNGRDGTVYLGADDSRQANALNWDAEYLKLIGEYLAGDHVITFGYEREDLSVFNKFVQHSRGGEYDYFDDSGSNPAFCAALSAQGRFDDPACATSGIDKFELGRPSRIYYGSGGGTNNADDAAANFGNVLHSYYIQDEIYFDDYDLTLVAGFRYETFTSDDRPNYNPTFSTANGIRNDANIDGLDLVMPRFGFTWGASETLQVRGGVGLYAGGNPNVWLSNAWSNDGLTNAQFRLDNFDGAIAVLPGSAGEVPLIGAGRPGYDVPQSLFDQVAAVTPTDANDSNIVLLDPNYKQPGQWKMALGASWDSPFWGVTADFDVLHGRMVDSVRYVDLSQARVGSTSAGQPIFDFVPGIGEGNFMLTNSDQTTTSTLISVLLNKSFDMGLDLSLGYAYTDANDVSPMTSSTAGSSFLNVATSNINYPSAGTSNYVVPHRFTMRAIYEAEWFGNNTTRLTLFGVTQEGQPASYVMSSEFLEGDNEDDPRHLLYVPTGPNDPNVIWNMGVQDQTDFFNFVAREGLSPGFQARNAQHAKWSTRFDFQVSQEVSFTESLYGRLYMRIYNFGNLLNKDWGKQYDAPFGSQDIINTGVDPVTGQYVFNSFSDRDINDLQEFRSLWELKLGIELGFN